MEKMKLFRLYTEDIQRKEIERIILTRFSSWTFLEGRGCWQGGRENSLIIEIIASAVCLRSVEDIARRIKRTNNQQSVLITVTDIEIEYI